MKGSSTPPQSIRVGDVVQVVRWPCCGVLLGYVFTVGSINQFPGEWRCCHCKAIAPNGEWAVSAEDAVNVGGHITWLKRIPPLDELDGKKSEDEMTTKNKFERHFKNPQWEKLHG